MIEVKEATQKASQYLQDFYPDADKIQIEEIEQDDENSLWLITLSFLAPDKESPYITNYKRNLKLFKIDSDTGDVKAMKIRELN